MSAAAFKERLRADLKTAMRERRPADVAVLRTLIAAIDNAEAVPVDGMAERIRLRENVGEIARVELDTGALDRVLAREIESRADAAKDYQNHGKNDEAARLCAEVELIARYRS